MKVLQYLRCHFISHTLNTRIVPLVLPMLLGGVSRSVALPLESIPASGTFFAEDLVMKILESLNWVPLKSKILAKKSLISKIKGKNW